MLFDTAMPTRVLRDEVCHLPGSVVTIGAFDGVHIGHRGLISAAVSEANARGLPSIVWTFDPPPKVFFGRAKQLCSLEEKLKRIAKLGPTFIVLASFDEAYCKCSAAEFMDDLMCARPVRVHVGGDFRFGAKQSGDVELLAARFNVTVQKPIHCAAGEVISSTRIRALHAEGRLAEAHALLDYPRKAPLAIEAQRQNAQLLKETPYAWN